MSEEQKLFFQSVVVGIPVRNEEKTLYDCLLSIREAIKNSGEKNIKLVICINGCTDNSESIAKDFKAKFLDIDCEVIESEEGLIKALKKITELYKADVYGFLDADALVDKNSLKLLLAALKSNSELAVAYARTEPFFDKNNKSLFHKIGFLYDTQKLLTKRYYFHGRFFVTKDWFAPSDEEILKRATKNRKNKVLLKYCKKGNFLNADDIFMSSYIMDKYGIKAIKQIDDAVCYAWPFGSFKDFLNIYRRRNIETEKMYRWFPEYNYLKPYLNRRTDWRKWLKANLKDKILWFVFLFCRNLFAIFLHLEFMLLNFSFYKPQEQWLVPLTTKKSFSG